SPSFHRSFSLVYVILAGSPPLAQAAIDSMVDDRRRPSEDRPVPRDVDRVDLLEPGVVLLLGGRLVAHARDDRLRHLGGADAVQQHPATAVPRAHGRGARRPGRPSPGDALLADVDGG